MFMLTEWGRRNLKIVFDPIARVLVALHITPNVVTFLGLLGNLIVAYLITTDRLPAAGLLYIIAAGSDAIDGTLARLLGVRNRFGAFWDSTLDRLGEAIVIASLGYWLARQGDTNGVLIAFAALVTSYLVSYTRARAEGLGMTTKVGIGTRVERFIIMVLGLLLERPVAALAVIALMAGVTVIQRITDIWLQTRKE
jgi:CDP-diacylglycerol--glycerol-3-phosphate 3-phosphatidyltransferase